MIELVFLDPALMELRQAAEWYDHLEAGVGQQFLHAVDQGLDRLLSDPSARPSVGSDIHRQFIERFPFDLLYRIQPL